MQQRRFGRVVFNLFVILAIVVSLAIVGCDGDDGVNVQDLQNRTFVVDDASVINSAFTGLGGATLAFGTAVGNTVPFTLTLGNGAVITGTATLNTPLTCESDAAVDVNRDGDTTDAIDAQEDEDVCDGEVELERTDSQELFTFSNATSNKSATVTFSEGQTGTSSGTVTTGGGTVSQ
jgi:hypothetical protein